MTTSKGGRTATPNNGQRSTARSAAAKVDGAARSRKNGQADQAAAATQATVTAWSSATAPFAGLAEASMQWLSQAAEMMSPKAGETPNSGCRSRGQRLDAGGPRLLDQLVPAHDPVLGRHARARQSGGRTRRSGKAAGPVLPS